MQQLENVMNRKWMESEIRSPSCNSYIDSEFKFFMVTGSEFRVYLHVPSTKVKLSTSMVTSSYTIDFKAKLSIASPSCSCWTVGSVGCVGSSRPHLNKTSTSSNGQFSKINSHTFLESTES